MARGVFKGFKERMKGNSIQGLYSAKNPDGSYHYLLARVELGRFLRRRSSDG